MKKVKEKKVQTREEQFDHQLHLVRQRFHEAKDTLEPAWELKPGDRVVIGNLEDPVVVDLLDGGRVVVVEHGARGKSFPGEEGLDRVRTPWHWWEVRPASKAERISEDASRYNLSFSNSQIDMLLGRYLSFGVDMEPPYQRGYVWSQEDREALIGSVLADLEIGRFVFRRMAYADGAPSYQIVDGKQRLRALVDYYLNKFPYRGKRFNDLCAADRRVFKEKGIMTADISERVPERTVIEIFVRLNVTGRAMSPEHLEAVRQKYLSDGAK